MDPSEQIIIMNVWHALLKPLDLHKSARAILEIYLTKHLHCLKAASKFVNLSIP